MSTRQHFTTELARKFGDEFGIDWDWICSNSEQFAIELDAEFEHGLHVTSKAATRNAPNVTDKMFFSNLNENDDYRSRLEELEGEAREENIQSIKLGYICWRKSHGCSSRITANSKKKLVEDQGL